MSSKNVADENITKLLILLLMSSQYEISMTIRVLKHILYVLTLSITPDIILSGDVKR